MKRFLPYIPFVLLLIVSVVSVGFSESHKNAQKCGDVVIAIDKGLLEKEFVKESDIYACINLKKEDIVGKKISTLSLHAIEEKIVAHPSIYSCACYFDVHGTLHISVEQRLPVLRVIGKHDSYYIDQYGRLMPLSKHQSARVIVASGNIENGFRKKHNVLLETAKDSSSLKDIFILSTTIAKHEFLSLLIEQIYVAAPKQYILISKVGPSKIEFGSMEQYEEKLQNLQAFYKSEKVRENWHLYERISVKYKNQIVCTKY